MTTEKNSISFTVDVDTICHYMAAYGKADPECANLAYEILLPRFLDLFEKWKIRATFFVTGDHLQKKENKKMLSRLSNAGHEIANHTFSHPPGFSQLTHQEKKQQIEKAHKAISDAISKSPIGFRAPAWDIDNETIAILQQQGYCYDSSCLPFAITTLRPILLGLKTKKMTLNHLKADPKILLPETKPYRTQKGNCWKPGNDNFAELPVSVLPALRMPFISTWIFQVAKPLTSAQVSIMKSHKGWMQFGMHALDLIDQENDPMDQRIKKIGHPVFKRKMQENQAMLEQVFKMLIPGRQIVTLKKAATNLLEDRG